MDLNRLTRDADDQIRKVVARYNQMYVPGGAISQVELDLLLDELRKLYDTFKTIAYINQTRLQHTPKPEVTVQSPSVPVFQAETLQEESTISNADPKPGSGISQQVLKPEFEQESIPDVLNDRIEEQVQETLAENYSAPEPDTASNDDTKEPPEEITNAEQAAVQKEEEKTGSKIYPDPTPTMLADLFNPVNRSLSETMARPPANDVVGGRMLFQPITDLSAGIGINDKFNFISELFGNNAGQYEEAITRINKAVNLDEANWILQKYHTPGWNQKQEALSRMKDFIKRRFI